MRKVSPITALLATSSIILSYGASFSHTASSSASSCPDTNLNHAGDLNLLELATGSDDGYFQWIVDHSTAYPNSLYVSTSADKCLGMAFHWKITSYDKIQIACGFQATGWGGIGFSETGGMRGADIVYFEARDGILTDAYVKDGYFSPIPDAVNDWELIRYNVTNDGYLIFEAERPLDTGDIHHDWPIVDDSSALISDHSFLSAWGDSSSISYHFDKKVKNVIQLFRESGSDLAGSEYDIFLAKMAENSDGNFTLLMEDNYSLPSSRTEYEERCHPKSEIDSILGIAEGAEEYRKFIVGYEFIVPEADKKYMHHMVLYGHDQFSCSFWSQMASFAWAPGDDFTYFPQGSGIAFGNSNSLDDINSFRLQYHVDNADFDEGFISGSGVRIYYTNTVPENEIGTFEVGDPTIAMGGNSVGAGYTKHDFTCDASCSNVLSHDGITIIAESLHMHEKGKKMVNQVIRDGLVVHEATTSFYDFVQMGAVQVQQDPYQFKKGDTFRTRCFYYATSGDKFGLGSDEEMCISFILYYPKVPGFVQCGPFSYCSASYNSESLTNESDLGRTFGISNVPTPDPTSKPSSTPSKNPSNSPSTNPSTAPTAIPSSSPSTNPSATPTAIPSSSPSITPTTSQAPSQEPSYTPSTIPSATPTPFPSSSPSFTPTSSRAPSQEPSYTPSANPSATPTAIPSSSPSIIPTTSHVPSQKPTYIPSNNPSAEPTAIPSSSPSITPTTSADPSYEPTTSLPPSYEPSHIPSSSPSILPSLAPTVTPVPSQSPSISSQPSLEPSYYPSTSPYSSPSSSPSSISSQPSPDPDVSQLSQSPSITSSEATRFNHSLLQSFVMSFCVLIAFL